MPFTPLPHPRYVKTVPLRTKTAREVAEAVLSGWIKGPGGVPERFQEDRGTEFTAMIAQAMYSKLGVHFQLGHSDNHSGQLGECGGNRGVVVQPVPPQQYWFYSKQTIFRQRKLPAHGPLPGCPRPGT